MKKLACSAHFPEYLDIHRSQVLGLSYQGTSNDTHDDPIQLALQFAPGHSQGHLIGIDFNICGETPAKWTVFPEVNNYMKICSTS